MRPTPEVSADNHLAVEEPPAVAAAPDIVDPLPYVPPPRPVEETELYTVVVNDVPVRELLFALARDAKLNIDLHPDITGVVTLNAIDQSLTQILQRLSRQVDLRYEVVNGTMVVGPDQPFFEPTTLAM